MASSTRPLLVQQVKNHVSTVRFNNPKKYNAWSQPMMFQMRDTFQQLAKDDTVKAAVLTGTGDYYCAGVDLAGVIQPMHPKKLLNIIETRNRELFELFIKFPKPIFVAANGPAIGAAVTSASLCDAVIATDKTTFHTPFSNLGLVPEGCSSYWFYKKLDESVAHGMLEESRKLSAQEALQAGLVQKIVPEDELLDNVQLLAEEWVESGKQRTIISEGEVEKLLQVNAEESIALANAFLSDRFFDAMIAQAKRKNRTPNQVLFQTIKATRGLWSKMI